MTDMTLEQMAAKIRSHADFVGSLGGSGELMDSVELSDIADAIDAHLAKAADYERAVTEQAMLTEAVSVTGCDPSDVIREVIRWHVCSAAQGEALAWIDHTPSGVVLRTLGECKRLEDLPHGTKLYAQPRPVGEHNDAHVATVYTMEALVPGARPVQHAEFHCVLPAGTKLYTAAAPDGEVG